ncbi:MAG: extracellular solute-binding protein, partial [candidate division Zixibacteria bacterium]|nr:extracellular solute-binding protein [candidate division Zixibacteria bacterium]
MTQFRFLLLFSLLTSFAAASEAQAPPPIRVEIPLFEGGQGLEFFLECARTYEQEHEGVVIDLYGDPRIHDKVRVRILERSFPEVTNARLNYWALIRNGDLLPLDEFLDQPNWEGDRTWRESFLPGTLAQYTHEGKTYGVPLMASAYAVWYNKNMFEENGWEPATTWEEFLELCEEIKAAGMWPLAFQGRYPGYVQ